MHSLGFILLSFCALFLPYFDAYTMYDEEKPYPMGSSSSISSEKNPRYILIVEDNRVIVKVACKLAAAKELTPIVATSFSEAIQRYNEFFEGAIPKKEGTVVGIISDHNLNTGSTNASDHMTGLAFVHYVRHDKENTTTPIIIYSGTTERNFLQRCLEQGATQVFNKSDTSYKQAIEYLLSLDSLPLR